MAAAAMPYPEKGSALVNTDSVTGLRGSKPKNPMSAVTID
jgi:hypothetical protein